MRPGTIVAGLILLGLGGAMLLENTGILHLHPGRLVAPFFLIAMGSAIVLDRGRRRDGEDAEDGGFRSSRRRRRHRSAGGFWLIGLGIWMLVSQTHLFGLDFRSSWPLLIVVSGLIMVIRGLR